MQRVSKETSSCRTCADGLRNTDWNLAQAAREMLFYLYKHICPGGVFQNFGYRAVVCVECSYRYYSNIIALSLSLRFRNEGEPPKVQSLKFIFHALPFSNLLSFVFLHQILFNIPALLGGYAHALQQNTCTSQHILPVRICYVPNTPHYPCKILLQYVLHRLTATWANTGVICRAYSASSHSPHSCL